MWWQRHALAASEARFARSEGRDRCGEEAEGVDQFGEHGGEEMWGCVASKLWH